MQVVRACVPAAAAGVAVGGLAAADGGFFPVSWGWAGVGLFWLATVALLVRSDLAFGPAEALALGCLAALTGWIALSILWSASVPATVHEVQRVLVYPAALLALLAVSRRDSGPALLGGVLAGITGVAAANLALRASGSLGTGTGAEAEPVGYANGLAILAAIGVVIAVGFLLRPPVAAARPAAAAALALLLAALALADSPGAWLACAAGTAAAAGLAAGRRRIAWALAAAALAAVVAGGVLLLPGNPRADYWRVAWRAVESEPLLGTGAGTFAGFWLEHRPAARSALDAHSLYLETLAELGPLGLAVLAVALAVPLAAAVRHRRHALVPPAFGAYAAYLVHAGYDWDWEQAGITVAAVACAAALLVHPRAGERERIASLRARGGAAIATALLGAVSLVGLAGSLELSASTEALASGEWRAATRHARRAASLAPWSAAARRNLGLAQLALGQRAAARGNLREALDLDPQNAQLWLDLAQATTGAERAAAIEQAARLDPLGAAGAPG